MGDEWSRFIKAQQFDYERALHEIKRGKKDNALDLVYFPTAKRTWTQSKVCVLWDPESG